MSGERRRNCDGDILNETRIKGEEKRRKGGREKGRRKPEAPKIAQKF